MALAHASQQQAANSLYCQQLPRCVVPRTRARRPPAHLPTNPHPRPAQGPADGPVTPKAKWSPYNCGADRSILAAFRRGMLWAGACAGSKLAQDIACGVRACGESAEGQGRGSCVPGGGARSNRGWGRWRLVVSRRCRGPDPASAPLLSLPRPPPTQAATSPEACDSVAVAGACVWLPSDTLLDAASGASRPAGCYHEDRAALAAQAVRGAGAAWGGEAGAGAGRGAHARRGPRLTGCCHEGPPSPPLPHPLFLFPQFVEHAAAVKALDVAAVGSCAAMETMRGLAAAEAACAAARTAVACAAGGGCSWVPSRRACQPSHAVTSELLGMDGELLSVAALCQAQASRASCLGAGNVTVVAAGAAGVPVTAAALGDEGWSEGDEGFEVVPIARTPEA
jgi:hypothetical protein